MDSFDLKLLQLFYKHQRLSTNDISAILKTKNIDYIHTKISLLVYRNLLTVYKDNNSSDLDVAFSITVEGADKFYELKKEFKLHAYKVLVDLTHIILTAAAVVISIIALIRSG